MDQQVKLDGLESQIIDQQLEKLQGLLAAYFNGSFIDGDQMKHLDEMCKLSHQARSLINKAE